jgi:hypothetical protein
MNDMSESHMQCTKRKKLIFKALAKDQMKKAVFTLLAILCAGVGSFAQKFDTTGCAKYVYYQYDKFTEERELWSYDPLTLTNIEGMPSSPLLAGSYKIEFRNNLAGRFLDKFMSYIILSNLQNNETQLKTQSGSGVMVYFIFEGNKKFNFKAAMTPSDIGYRIDLPLQGEIMMHFKTKKLTAIRIAGNTVGNIDFDLENKHSNHLLNELNCMFGYK